MIALSDLRYKLWIFLHYWILIEFWVNDPHKSKHLKINLSFSLSLLRKGVEDIFTIHIFFKPFFSFSFPDIHCLYSNLNTKNKQKEWIRLIWKHGFFYRPIHLVVWTFLFSQPLMKDQHRWSKNNYTRW